MAARTRTAANCLNAALADLSRFDAGFIGFALGITLAAVIVQFVGGAL